MASNCEIKLDAIKISVDSNKSQIVALKAINQKVLDELKKISSALGA